MSSFSSRARSSPLASSSWPRRAAPPRPHPAGARGQQQVSDVVPAQPGDHHLGLVCHDGGRNAVRQLFAPVGAAFVEGETGLGALPPWFRRTKSAATLGDPRRLAVASISSISLAGSRTRGRSAAAGPLGGLLAAVIAGASGFGRRGIRTQ
jgi:hypothetical protein